MATFNSSEPDSAVQISSNGAEQTHIYQGKFPEILLVWWIHGWNKAGGVLIVFYRIYNTSN